MKMGMESMRLAAMAPLCSCAERCQVFRKRHRTRGWPLFSHRSELDLCGNASRATT